MKSHEKLGKVNWQGDVFFGMASLHFLYKGWHLGVKGKSFSSSPEYYFSLLLFKRSFLYRVKTLSKLKSITRVREKFLKGKGKKL